MNNGFKVAMALGMVLLASSLLYAPPEGDKGGDAAAEASLIDLFKAGGFVGYFITLVSVACMGLTIEHIVNIKRDKLVPPAIVAELEALVDNGQYEDAIALCNANPSFFTNIIGPTLSKVTEGYDVMSGAMSEAGEEQSAKLNQKVSWLSLLGSIAPMLGLTGTVTGMIAAFGIIKTKSSPAPADLARGVEEALVTTAMGLFVAMPTLTAYFIFKNKVAMFTMEIGMLCGEFLDKFRGLTPEQK